MMPSRQAGNLAAAVVFALLAIFLFCARDENGAWRTRYLCLPTSSNCPREPLTAPVTTDPSGSTQPPAKGSSKNKSKPDKKKTPTALSKNIVDEATGLSLPRHKKFSKTELTCLGVGVRAKKIAIAKVNVYSVGLYVEPKGARRALKKFAGSDPEKLHKDASLYKILGQAGGFTKYLHLVFARTVGAKKVVDALTSVKGVSEAALSQFSTIMLDAVGKDIGKKETVSLGWEGKDKMVVVVRDKIAGTVTDAALPKAVFDLFLGSSPVSPEAKAAFAEGVPAFVSS